MDIKIIIDCLLAVIWTLIFWQVLKVVPLVFKNLGLEKLTPKVHIIFKAAFFCYFYIGMNESLSEESFIINKFTSSFYYSYEHLIFVLRVLAIIVPILFVFKMLGINFEDVFNAESPTRKGSSSRKSAFIKPFEPSRSSSASYRYLPSNIHYRK